jgi:hypothetical protein
MIRAHCRIPTGHALAISIAPHDSANPSKQVTRAERLGDVVVRTKLETHHPARLLGTGGDDDDRNLLGVADLEGESHLGMADTCLQLDVVVARVAGVAFSGFLLVLNWSLHLLADGSDGRTAADVPGAQGGEQCTATLLP